MEARYKSLESLVEGDKVYCYGGEIGMTYRRTIAKTKEMITFTNSFFEKVIKTEIQYDEHSGAPYKIITLECNWKFDSRSGKAIESPYCFKIASDTEELDLSVFKSPGIFVRDTLMYDSSRPDNDFICLSKDELKTFYDDACTQTGNWSDTSYKICEFIGIDPTAGT